jgi:hypothetical protein
MLGALHLTFITWARIDPRFIFKDICNQLRTNLQSFIEATAKHPW